MSKNTFTYEFNYTVNGTEFAVTQENCDVFQADEFAGFVQKGFENFAGFDRNRAQMFDAYMNTICQGNNWTYTGFNPFA